MLKHYVFWGVFALVQVGMVATLLRDRARRLRNEAAQPRTRAAEDSVARRPAASPLEAAFDPTATRIYSAPPAARMTPEAERDAAMLPPSASPRLAAVSGALKGKRFAVTAAGIKVGRDPDNSIVIADPRVSHHHAWIGIVDNRAVLRDLGSTNGTFLNARLDAPVTEAALMPGDTIFFGGHGGDQFRFLVD